MPGALHGLEIDAAPIFSKVDFAYQAVKRRILDGTLEPGSEIDQHMIAEQISLSTTPVREALRRLEVEGFVILVARQAARVRELDPGEFQDLLEVRILLEPVAARLAATHAGVAERGRADELARLIGDSPLEQQRINRHFHRCIYASCDNEIMTQTLDAVYDHCDRYSLQLLQDPSDYVQSVSQDHTQLAQAYIDRDPDAMQELMRTHLANSRSLLCSKAEGLAEDHRLGGTGTWIRRRRKSPS